MEIFELEEDIITVSVTARSFPDCIQEAFVILMDRVPDMAKRTCYGISSKTADCRITYKAAVEALSRGEAGHYGLEEVVIKKGTYLSESIIGWRENIPSIAETFGRLLADPRMDHSQPCVEWYKKGDEVTCMVKIHAE